MRPDGHFYEHSCITAGPSPKIILTTQRHFYSIDIATGAIDKTVYRMSPFASTELVPANNGFLFGSFTGNRDLSQRLLMTTVDDKTSEIRLPFEPANLLLSRDDDSIYAVSRKQLENGNDCLIEVAVIDPKTLESRKITAFERKGYAYESVQLYGNILFQYGEIRLSLTDLSAMKTVQIQPSLDKACKWAAARVSDSWFYLVANIGGSADSVAYVFDRSLNLASQTYLPVQLSTICSANDSWMAATDGMRTILAIDCNGRYKTFAGSFIHLEGSELTFNAGKTYRINLDTGMKTELAGIGARKQIRFGADEYLFDGFSSYDKDFIFLQLPFRCSNVYRFDRKLWLQQDTSYVAMQLAKSPSYTLERIDMDSFRITNTGDQGLGIDLSGTISIGFANESYDSGCVDFGQTAEFDGLEPGGSKTFDFRLDESFSLAMINVVSNGMHVRIDAPNGKPVFTGSRVSDSKPVAAYIGVWDLKDPSRGQLPMRDFDY
jgi:hypothetical protein